MEDKKILIAYYSHTGNTKAVAEAIAKKTGGDLFEIITDAFYPVEYKPMSAKTKDEIEQGYRPKLTKQVKHMEEYDIVFVGSPNWWGTIAPSVSSFLEEYDFSDKNVIPFITHSGGGVQNTITNMTAQCKGGKVNQYGWVGFDNTTIGLDLWVEKVTQ